MAIKIIVTIDIGRKSYGCTRFGVCSITVGAELAIRPNQDIGVIEWEQGTSIAKLHFRGKDSLSDQGICVVPIDQAIRLPLPCTNGIDWFVRQGKYAVQRNANGEFLALELSPVHPI